VPRFYVNIQVLLRALDHSNKWCLHITQKYCSASLDLNVTCDHDGGWKVCRSPIFSLISRGKERLPQTRPTAVLSQPQNFSYDFNITFIFVFENLNRRHDCKRLSVTCCLNAARGASLVNHASLRPLSATFTLIADLKGSKLTRFSRNGAI